MTLALAQVLAVLGIPGYVGLGIYFAFKRKGWAPDRFWTRQEEPE